jgi:DinB superfamily
MDALQLFLIEHARAHSDAVAPASGPLWLEDSLLLGLTDDQLRVRPSEGDNSLAWLLWHIARIEDVAINVVLMAQPQVLHEGGWQQRLKIAYGDVGTGMAEEDVADLGARVDIPALRAYRAAVGRRTRELVGTIKPEELGLPVTAMDVERAVASGAFGAGADWLRSFWEGRPKAWYLSWTSVGHSYLHLGEAMGIKGHAGLGRGR